MGSSQADLENYFTAHSAQFDTACLTAAVFSSEAAAQDAAAQVAFGTPFATVASNTSSSGGGAQGCDVLADLESKLPVGCGTRQPGDRSRLGADQRQRDVSPLADHLTDADAVQQGQGRGGERRPGGGFSGHPEGADARTSASPR